MLLETFRYFCFFSASTRPRISNISNALSPTCWNSLWSPFLTFAAHSICARARRDVCVCVCVCNKCLFHLIWKCSQFFPFFSFAAVGIFSALARHWHWVAQLVHAGPTFANWQQLFDCTLFATCCCCSRSAHDIQKRHLLSSFSQQLCGCDANANKKVFLPSCCCYCCVKWASTFNRSAAAVADAAFANNVQLAENISRSNISNKSISSRRRRRRFGIHLASD